MSIEDKINGVKEELRGKHVAIAFSGGADSSLLSSLIVEVCRDPIAITIDNGLMPTGFIENSKKIAHKIGISQKIVKIDLFNVDEFRENKGNRCYLCRQIMYDKIKEVAHDESIDIIVDGNNISDLFDDRPGILITYKNNFLTPLINEGISSDEVKKYLKENNIEYNKSTTCLATRIKTNIPLNHENIKRIDYGEEFIKNINKDETIKIRDNNNNAEIEIEKPYELDENKINLIGNKLKTLKFNNILLNITPKTNKNRMINFKSEQSISEIKLPYTINISNSIEKLKEIGKIKTLNNNTLILSFNNKNVIISEKGKIIIENVKDFAESKETLINILPFIRRNI